MKRNDCVCGECVYHKPLNIARKPLSDQPQEFVCTNEESDYYALETDYNDTCGVAESK